MSSDQDRVRRGDVDVNNAHAKKLRRQTLIVAEASTGGLVSASLLSTAGASRFFLGSCTLYAAPSMRDFLPHSVLRASRIMDTKHNYANATNYVQSKRLFAVTVAEGLRHRAGATWGLCESGTVGPNFMIPGLTRAFTVVAVAGPVARVEVVWRAGQAREANMWAFSRAALRLLEDCVDQHLQNLQHTRHTQPQLIATL